MSNKLGIPAEGINFCLECFQFKPHTVKVDESGSEVEVTLTCECGHSVTVSDSKDSFYEYDDETAAV